MCQKVERYVNYVGGSFICGLGHICVLPTRRWSQVVRTTSPKGLIGFVLTWSSHWPLVIGPCWDMEETDWQWQAGSTALKIVSKATGWKPWTPHHYFRSKGTFQTRSSSCLCPEHFRLLDLDIYSSFCIEICWMLQALPIAADWTKLTRTSLVCSLELSFSGIAVFTVQFNWISLFK